MTEELKQLRDALSRVKYEAASLADAQVIALEALTAAQPAQTDNMGMPTSCGKPLCAPDEHHPLCKLHKPAQPAQAEREAFEAWAKKSAIRTDLGAWDAWQARASLPTQPAQAGEVVRVPLQILRDASAALGNFVSDHGWGDADMQAMDNLDAYIARIDAYIARHTAAQQGATNG